MAQIVGDGILSFYIQYLVAIPDYRKQGVRKKLVLKAIDKIKKTYNPDASISLFTSIRNIPFYSKLGFTVRPNEQQDPAMVYYLEENPK